MKKITELEYIFNLETDSSGNSLYCINKTFDYEIEISTNPFHDSITLFLDNCIFKKTVTLSGLTLGSFIFQNNCIFEDDLNLTGIDLSSQLKIENCEFKSNFTLFMPKSKHLVISDSKFNGDITIEDFTVNNKIVFFNNLVEQSFELKNCLNEIEFKINVDDEKKIINNLSVQNVKKIHIGGNERTLSVNDLQFYQNKSSDSSIILTNLLLNRLILSGVVNGSSVSFQNLKSNKKENLKLDLLNSNLNNSEFLDCDFSDFDLKIKSTKIENLQLNGTFLPNPNRINVGSNLPISHTFDALQSFKKKLDSKGDIFNSNKYFERELILKLENCESSDFKTKKDIFSHLKKLYDQTGDSVKALEYQAKELEEYRKSITWRDRFWEKSNLFINKITNNYGTNWAQALLVTLLSNYFFYFFFCQSLGFEIDVQKIKLIIIGFNLHTYFDYAWNTFWELFSYSPEFLNPLRKAEFIDKIDGIKVEYSNWSRLIDYSARIVVTICVYQLIQAFRKYGKK